MFQKDLTGDIVSDEREGETRVRADSQRPTERPLQETWRPEQSRGCGRWGVGRDDPNRHEYPG